MAGRRVSGRPLTPLNSSDTWSRLFGSEKGSKRREVCHGGACPGEATVPQDWIRHPFPLYREGRKLPRSGPFAEPISRRGMPMAYRSCCGRAGFPYFSAVERSPYGDSLPSGMGSSLCARSVRGIWIWRPGVACRRCVPFPTAGCLGEHLPSRYSFLDGSDRGKPSSWE